jgi:hypothetical protein
MLLLLAGCGSKENNKPAAAKPTPIKAKIQLKADEKKSSFDKSRVSSAAGTIMITVVVPANAKGQHGVGINGGTYKNIVGAPVKPGRATSLTVAVKPGTYTIFDSYKSNKSKGYTTKLVVKK